MARKGFSGIALIIIIVILAGIGYFLWHRSSQAPAIVSSITNSTSTSEFRTYSNQYYSVQVLSTWNEVGLDPSIYDSRHQYSAEKLYGEGITSSVTNDPKNMGQVNPQDFDVLIWVLPKSGQFKTLAQFLSERHGYPNNSDSIRFQAIPANTNHPAGIEMILLGANGVPDIPTFYFENSKYIYAIDLPSSQLHAYSSSKQSVYEAIAASFMPVQ